MCGVKKSMIRGTNTVPTVGGNYIENDNCWCIEMTYKDLEKRKSTQKKYRDSHENERKKYPCHQKEVILPIQRVAQRRRHHRRRKEIMEYVGGAQCKKCGINDYRVLHLDHIDGDGFKDKKKRNMSARIAYYWKHPEEAKKTLQVLCANCHAMKSWDNKEYQMEERR